MEQLRQFFQTLARVIIDGVGYMFMQLAGNESYRQGFGAAVVFLVVVFGLAQLIPAARGRFVNYWVARPPSLKPGDSSEVGTLGCLWGGGVLLVLTILFLGLLWGALSGA